jgi:hypothetical protein
MTARRRAWSFLGASMFSVGRSMLDVRVEGACWMLGACSGCEHRTGEWVRSAHYTASMWALGSAELAEAPDWRLGECDRENRESYIALSESQISAEHLFGTAQAGAPLPPA